MASKAPPDGSNPPPLQGSEGKPALSAVGRPEGWSMQSDTYARPLPTAGLFGQPSAQRQQQPGGPAASTVPAAQPSTAAGSNSDRISRLAQQKKRIAEQRAKMQGGQSVAGTAPTGSTPARPPPPASQLSSGLSARLGSHALTGTDASALPASSGPASRPSRPTPAPAPAASNASTPATSAATPPSSSRPSLSGVGRQQAPPAEASSARRGTQGTAAPQIPFSAQGSVGQSRDDLGPQGTSGWRPGPTAQRDVDKTSASDLGGGKGSFGVGHAAVAGVGVPDGIGVGTAHIATGGVPSSGLASAIPFGIADSGGSGQDFFAGGDLGPVSPEAPPSTTKGPPAKHLSSKTQGEVAELPEQEAPKAATIPFGRSGSQVSLGHCSRGGAWKVEEEADDGLGFFEDETGPQPGNGQIGGVAANGHGANSRGPDLTAVQHLSGPSKPTPPQPGAVGLPQLTAAIRSGHAETVPSDDGADFFADSPSQGAEPTSERQAGDARSAAGEAQAPLPGDGVMGSDAQPIRSQNSVSPFTAMSSSAPIGWGHGEGHADAPPEQEWNSHQQAQQWPSAGETGAHHSGYPWDPSQSASHQWQQLTGGYNPSQPAQSSAYHGYGDVQQGYGAEQQGYGGEQEDFAYGQQEYDWSQQGHAPTGESSEAAPRWQQSQSQASWQDGRADTGAYQQGYEASYPSQTEHQQNSEQAQPEGRWGYGANSQPQPANASHDWQNAAHGQNDSSHPSAWDYSQQSYSQPTAQSKGAPKSVEEAVRNPHGRPPIPLLAFGFGGRAVAMLPQPGPTSELSQGPLRLLRVEGLSASLAGLQGQFLPGQVGRVDSTANFLRAFPGLLTASTSKDKVLKFVDEQIAGESAASPQDGDMQLLWRLLRLLVQHNGALRPLGSLEKEKAPPKTKSGQPSTGWAEELGRLLLPLEEGAAGAELGADTHWDQGRLLAEGAAPGPGAEMAALEVQKALQLGRQTDALRIAMEGRLWGPALVLAGFCGEAAVLETTSRMADACLQQGTPLHTLCASLCGPATPAAATSASEAGSSPPLEDWRGSVAILASSSAPRRDAALLQLGDRLWTGPDRVVAGHMCFILGGLPAFPYDATARMCLPGVDHRSWPGALSDVRGIQRGILLEWARSQGKAGNPQTAAVLLPYRLVLAERMAEYGMVDAASQQCAAVVAGLNALGGRLPGGLLVTRKQASDLQDRLMKHAEAFRIHIAHGSGAGLMSKASKWLDKGLSRLIGVSELPEGVQGQVQGGGGGGDASKPPPGPHHRRSSSQPDVAKPPVRRSVSAAEMSLGQPFRPHSGSEAPVSAPTSAANSPARPSPERAPPPPMQKAPSLSVRGFLGKVSSFTGMLAPAPSAKHDDDSALGVENTLYYDNELKLWREKGKPPPSAPAPLAPPPIVSAPPPSLEPPPTIAEGPPVASGGVQNRYVNTLSTRQPSGGLQQSINPAAPPPFFNPHGAAPKSAAPSFFMPQAANLAPQVPAWSTTSRTRGTSPVPPAVQGVPRSGSASSLHHGASGAGSQTLPGDANLQAAAGEDYMTDITL